MTALLGRFNLAQLAREAEHELLLREAVYPARVRAGRMSNEEAKTRVQKMREIARFLRAQAEEADHLEEGSFDKQL
jgi:hypothetical protein